MYAFNFPECGWCRQNDKTSQNSPLCAKFVNLDLNGYIYHNKCSRRPKRSMQEPQISAKFYEFINKIKQGFENWKLKRDRVTQALLLTTHLWGTCKIT